jgi:putative ABC transport system permease protein
MARSASGGLAVPLRVLGADALVLPGMAPTLMPRPWDGSQRFALFEPATVFLNAAAFQALGLPTQAAQPAPTLVLQAGSQSHMVRVAGSVAAGGSALAVMDLGAAQDLFGRGGALSRIDLRLQPGTDRSAFAQALRSQPWWPAHAMAVQPGDAAERISLLSRAYRVNLTVLALVALFTGAFLVFSVLALSVAQRAPQFALLAVLGATPGQRLALVLLESGLLGLAGSVAGIALGTLLAQAALHLLGGDLGGGYFAGVQPALRWSTATALLYGSLGLVAALAGGWWPARNAQALPPAQTLKGLGQAASAHNRATAGLALLAAATLLALAPPIAGVPVAAYLSVGLLLVGGMALLPWAVALLLRLLHPLAASRALPLLALERTRRMRGSAAIAIGGVVASLSLAVALTVMVASFRGSVMQWLDAVLPAPLYLRSSLQAAGGDAALLPATLAQDVARLSGVQRVEPQRASPVQLDPARPALTLLARPLGSDPAQRLPLVDAALPVPPGRVGIYISEAVVDLYGLQPGLDWPELSRSFSAPRQDGKARAAPFFIAGVWRDYARQSGAVALDMADYERLTDDTRPTDLALWLQPGTDSAALRQAIEALAPGVEDGTHRLEFVSADAIRARSLHIFDRSFAVTYWLQAVAIGIGLFGVAASFGAQVLARRKEFGLLAHLGLTRRQILAVVAAEGAAWTGVGAAAGLLLGLAVSVVLVHVVNPQSFHWTMDLRVPLGRLLALCAAVVLAGTVTAWVAGRAAAGRDAVLAVKEDW